MPRDSLRDSEDEHRFFSIAEALADESRRDIVADIVGHPESLPSMQELTFTTGLHRSTVREHLEVLINAGIVERVEIPVGERQKGDPSTFYGVTNGAREVFDQNDVFIEEHWQATYDRIDKPKEIERAEAAPRPDQ